MVTAGGNRVRENVLLDSLTALLDRVLREQYPPAWSSQPATLVYKGKGAESDPNNHIPIQCQGLFVKLLSIILRARLDAFATSQRLRAEGKAAFVSGRRTSDHIFLLRHLIDRSRLLRGGAGPVVLLLC